ncbi:MAG: sulfotransferase [Alphaproteobacteria bacterium]
MAQDPEDPANEKPQDPSASAKALLQQGRPSEAVEAARTALAQAPGDRDTLYVLAVSYRYLKDLDAALSVLGELKVVHPGFGRAHQEEGHIFRHKGDMAAALDAFRQAVGHNPALVASWQALADLAAGQQNPVAADAYAREVARLTALPPALLSVMSFIHEGRLLKAEQLARDFLQKNKHHIEGMRLLAEIGMRLHVLDDAEFLLESCVALAPEHRRAHLDYVTVLNKRQKYEKALEQAQALRAKEPDNPAFITALANQELAVGHHETALGLYDAVLERLPDNPTTLLSKGHALKTVGKRDDAVAAYRAAYGARPAFGDAFWSLANLKTYRFTDDERRRMEDAEAAPDTPHTDRFHLCFALGKAWEDAGDAGKAFTYYARGNALKRAELRFDADLIDREFAAQKAVCTPDLFAAKKDQGCPAPDPIFILGLPRAGSTLLEQILASHPDVDGTLELPNILALAHRLNGRRRLGDEARYPAILHDLTADQIKDFGEQYLEETRVYRQGAPFFTDKMPNNFRHIGLIHLILPQAKIIDARRSALDCCVSCFKQLFAEGQEFTYSLDDVGRYYRGYVDLMDHWDRVLPGRILRVQHEDVLADLEGQVRRMLDFCGLPFHEACLTFDKTERSVRTASAEQVRRPLNTDGAGQWQKFAPYLDDLNAALGPLVGTHTRGPGAPSP